MGKADILDVVSELSLADRSEILARLLQLEAADDLRGPSASEKQVLCFGHARRQTSRRRDEATAAMAKLEQAPNRHPEYYRNTRRAFLARFPYKVFFLIEGQSVVVLRVLHARQDHVRRMKRIR